jgi:hypothetical protein
MESKSLLHRRQEFHIFLNETRYGLLHNLLGVSPSVVSQLEELAFSLWGEMNFHQLDDSGEDQMLSTNTVYRFSSCSSASGPFVR